MDNFIKISVVMSTYNNETSIEKAILSIVNQSFTEWELLIVDDASKDNTNKILKKLVNKYNRIQYFTNQSNKGLAYNLNKLIKISKGKYIARMDADDISMPNRLAKQYKFLENNSKISVLGTAAKVIYNNKSKNVFPPVLHEDIIKNIILKTPFIHPTVIMRKSFLINNNFYRTDIGEVEDLDLWLRTCNNNLFHNLHEVLLIYEFSGQKYSRIIRSFILHLNFSIRKLNMKFIFHSFLVLLIVTFDKLNIRKLSSLK